ncbi:general secretion pathway protein GspK [Rubrivivax sp. JA1024]|nr:general secretion pathway protein GspK [Rubrivivax sp. JA1024]
MRRRTCRRDRGYVLVSVLAALVVLAVVAARLDARAERWRDERGNWSRWQQEQMQAEASRDTLMGCLLTSPLAELGFTTPDGVLRVDGRVYRLPDETRFSLQDARGLISVAEPQADLLRRFLAGQGLNPQQADRLVDTLADYVDADDLRRLNGAEAADYAQAGLPPPANDWLTSPYELRRVLGWHDYPALWERASDDFSTVRQGWINPNTAPPAVLRALPGATPEGIAALLAQRETRAMRDAADLLATAGILVDDEGPAFHPGLVYRLRLWRDGSPRLVEYTVMLTLTAPASPWALLEVRQLPRQPDDANANLPDAERRSPTGSPPPAQPPLVCAHLASP